MIAKITRGSRMGDIGAYLHGPGKANEHTYTDAAGQVHSGGQVIASNIGAEGHTNPARWVPELRAAQKARPSVKKSVWQTSLRNTAGDRELTDGEWANIAQSFAEGMGFEGHPWVAVRHGSDHIHVVVSRVDYEGNVWRGDHDRRQAQSVCTQLEREYGLEQAPRRKVSAKQRVQAVRAGQREKVAAVGERRANVKRLTEMYERLNGAFAPMSAAPKGRRGGLPAAVRGTMPDPLKAARKPRSGPGADGAVKQPWQDPGRERKDRGIER